MGSAWSGAKDMPAETRKDGGRVGALEGETEQIQASPLEQAMESLGFAAARLGVSDPLAL